MTIELTRKEIERLINILAAAENYPGFSRSCGEDIELEQEINDISFMDLIKKIDPERGDYDFEALHSNQKSHNKIFMIMRYHEGFMDLANEEYYTIEGIYSEFEEAEKALKNLKKANKNPRLFFEIAIVNLFRNLFI